MEPFSLLLLHAAVTWYLLGLIWTVQLVQYPLLADLDSSELRRLHPGYVRRITWAVGPAMVLEAVLAIAVPALVPGVPTWLWAAGLALVVLIWGSTALLQVPLHGRLGGGDRPAARRLVASNWVRTVAWSGRALLAGWLLLPAAG